MAKGGDFAKFAELQSKIKSLGRKFVARAARAMGNVNYDLAQGSVSEGKAPTGRRWAPRKDGGRALRAIGTTLTLRVRTGLLRAGFDLIISRPWALIHQVGARRRGTKWKLPARRMLPKNALPPRWAKRSVQAVLKEWDETWK